MTGCAPPGISPWKWRRETEGIGLCSVFSVRPGGWDVKSVLASGLLIGVSPVLLREEEVCPSSLMAPASSKWSWVGPHAVKWPLSFEVSFLACSLCSHWKQDPFQFVEGSCNWALFKRHWGWIWRQLKNKNQNSRPHLRWTYSEAFSPMPCWPCVLWTKEGIFSSFLFLFLFF